MLLSFLVISKNGISAYIKECGEFINTPVLQQPAFQMFRHKCDFKFFIRYLGGENVN